MKTIARVIKEGAVSAVAAFAALFGTSLTATVTDQAIEQFGPALGSQVVALMKTSDMLMMGIQ